MEDHHQSHTRPRHRQRSLPRIQPGHVALRLLCPGHVIGGVIGNNGSVVSQLRRVTGTGIHCQNSNSDGDEGTVFVFGPPARDRTVAVDGEELAVSRAQAALVRVLERIWEIESQEDEDPRRRRVRGRLVACGSQVRVLMGNGGSIIAKLRDETLARIRILPCPNLFPSGEEIVEIWGTVSAVKKAVIAVSGYIQDHPEPLENLTAEVSSNFNSVLPRFPSDDPNADDRGTSDADEKGTWQVVVFRLVFSNEAAGGVIGRKGAVVKWLENENRATIVFSAPPADGFSDRVATISAFENLESENSPAQNAVVRVFARAIEGDAERGSLPHVSDTSMVTVKLLVSSDQICCLSDRVISEISGVSGTVIHLQGDEQENRIVQITGGYKAVQDVLFQLTSILRDYLLYREVVKEGKPKKPFQWMTEAISSCSHQSLGFSANVSDELILTSQMNRLGIYESSGDLSPRSQLPQTLEIGNDNVSTNGRLNGDLEAKSTNTIVEIVVSEDAFGSIYGEDGANLNRIKEISGANVEVRDPRPGENEGRVVISGTPDQTLAARSLLQAFIQAN